MNLAIVTCAYDGYGKFVDQWLDSIEGLNKRPAHVVVALGRDHGMSASLESVLAKYSRLNLQFHFTDAKPLMGPMRNAAVGQTETEWVQYVSVDDAVLPNEIDEFEKYETNADYICISWLSQPQWYKKGEEAPMGYHRGKTPQTLVQKYNGRGFIVGHSPFRKKFWDMEPYMNHDYPNAPFVAGMVKNGARFVATAEACTIYQQRLDSHAARLGRRRETKIETERRKAIYWKQYLKQTMLEYYS